MLVSLLMLVLVSMERPGVPPDTPWSCPTTHPIKGYLSAEPGRRIYHLPGGRFYEEASPERCYATEDDALRDGSRPAHRPSPELPNDDRVERAEGAA
jgi:hypothetical protein